jgi:hypothetical protein
VSELLSRASLALIPINQRAWASLLLDHHGLPLFDTGLLPPRSFTTAIPRSPDAIYNILDKRNFSPLPRALLRRISLQRERSMNSGLRNILAVVCPAISAQASAKVTFYEREGIAGQSFSTGSQVGNLERFGFNDRASSVNSLQITRS